MSLKPCYDVFWRDGLHYAVLYWLAVPTLLVIHAALFLIGLKKDVVNLSVPVTQEYCIQ